jgi:type IV secretion system protein VirB4
MGSLRDLMSREVDVGRFLPYTSPVTESIVKLGDLGTYVFSVEMGGVAHACADASDINSWHAQLCQMTRQIADPRVALHSHVVHDPVDDFPDGEFRNRFAREYNDKYRAYMTSRNMHATRLFLSAVYRPKDAAERFASRFSRPSQGALIERQLEDIEAAEDLRHTVLAGLEAFAPRLLSCYEHEGVLCSRTLELFGRILNDTWERVPLPRAPIRDVLPRMRPFFGKGGLLSRKGATSIGYGALLAIKEYPTPTFPGKLNALHGEGYPWVLSQSFTYLSDIVAKDAIEQQLRRMVNAGDRAKSQIKKIRTALDELVSGEIAMGHHEMSLAVSAPDVRTLDNRIAAAGAVLSQANITWLREDIGLGSAFYAMLPGNLSYRVDPQMIDNRNFSGLISPHNYPAGRLDGAQWGPAVTLFQSEAGSPVAFNWHQPDPDPAAKLDPNHKEPATTVVIGKTGLGKTLLLGHLLTQSQKFGVFPEGFPGVAKLSCVVFDKDLGMAIAVPALCGKHYRIKTGVQSGLAPFQMAPTPANLDFLDRLVTKLVTNPRRDLTEDEQKRITQAVHAVMGSERALRRLGAVLEFFSPDEPDGIHARLAKWCEGGKYGWLFDNEVDTIDMDHPVVGFDVTDFLQHPATCAPLMMYLLHRVDELTDGRRIPIFVDEAPTLFADKAFAAYLNLGLVQIRKKDGFYVLAAQYPRQILESPLAAALVSQPATMIFLADDKADMNDLVRGFKRTEAEVMLIRSLGKRQALLCQGATSTVIDLTLKGFEDEIAVLSGNSATSRLCGELIDELGPDPDRWLPEFHRRRKAA